MAECGVKTGSSKNRIIVQCSLEETFRDLVKKSNYAIRRITKTEKDNNFSQPKLH